VQSLHNNEAGIEALYHQHGPALLLFALDALHQVFLRLLERADLRQIAEVKSYLFASVRNAIGPDGLDWRSAMQRELGGISEQLEPQAASTLAKIAPLIRAP
jgi:hypothetical protein